MPDPEAVYLTEYDPAWPARFTAAAHWLRDLLDERWIGRIEHVGSTAIPGMIAKPIIDMFVEVPSFELALPNVVPVLTREGCEYFWRDDRPPGHMMFLRHAGPDGARDLHMHMAPPGHKLWERLAFRDYVIAHPNRAAEYAALKQELARRYPEDREAYTAGKGPLVRELTDLALSTESFHARASRS